MTANPGFKVMVLFKGKDLNNGACILDTVTIGC